MPVTCFWDMHSGGSEKLKWSKIYIQAEEEVAIEYFKRKFMRDPYNITCDCCGEDYVVTEDASLLMSTAYHRACTWDDTIDDYGVNSGKSLSDYLASDSVLFIPAEDFVDFVSPVQSDIEKLKYKLELGNNRLEQDEIDMLLEIFNDELGVDK